MMAEEVPILCDEKPTVAVIEDDKDEKCESPVKDRSKSHKHSRSHKRHRRSRSSNRSSRKHRHGSSSRSRRRRSRSRSRHRSRSRSPAIPRPVRHRSRSRDRSERRSSHHHQNSARPPRSPSRSAERLSDEGFDSDDGVRDNGYINTALAKDHIHRCRRRVAAQPAKLSGDTPIELCTVALHQNVRGRYGTWHEYLRFLHEYGKGARPPPGTDPGLMTPRILYGFLRSLHETDKVGDVEKVLASVRGKFPWFTS